MAECPSARAWRMGRDDGPVVPLVDAEFGIWCWICGRLLAQGEDFGRWRLRVVRPSPRWQFELRTICPAHYEPPPSPIPSP